MYQIQNLTDDSRQSQSLVLPDGTSIDISIYFVPMQYGWFITSLTYGTFELDGIRICNSPNILYQWRNQIPFGLACISFDDREPSQQQDFITGASSLYILTQDEVSQYTEFLSG